MSKFLVIYHAPAAAMEMMATATPEQKAEGMKPWAAWMEKVGAQLVDGGSPFMPGTRINADGSEQPSTNEVTGYSMVEADSLDEAKKLVADHPHLKWWEGCALEVFECIPMG